jgi:peptidoglycan hydrolase-like protein with peptidoglycan-binding domain
MADEPELALGDSGDWVEYLQELLAERGYQPGGLDGHFGVGVEYAVRALQTAAGLHVNGVVDAATWSVLIAGYAGQSGGSEDFGDVPTDLIVAGAPARLADWSDEQRHAYFVGEQREQVGGDPPDSLEVAPVRGAGDRDERGDSGSDTEA